MTYQELEEKVVLAGVQYLQALRGWTQNDGEDNTLMMQDLAADCVQEFLQTGETPTINEMVLSPDFAFLKALAAVVWTAEIK